MLSALQRLGVLASRNYRRVFQAFALLVGVSLVLASRLSFDTDVMNLLPRRDPVVQTFRETLQEFGSIDLLLVVVRLPESETLEPYEALVDQLGEDLATLPELEYVDYRVGDLEELISSFLPRSMLFLDRTGLERVAESLSEEGIARRVEELRRLISTPQSMALKSLLLTDPLGLSEVFLDSLGQAPGGLSVDVSSGYYLSQDRRMLLLLAKPIRPAQDIDFDRQLVTSAEATIERSLASWSGIAGPGHHPPPEIVLGGGYLTALDDASLIKGDIIINAVSSMAVVLLLFLFAFRRLGPLLYAFVPLAGGLILAFGFSALALGTLSSATSGVAALLIGLGIDFVIVSYARYVEERRAGVSFSGSVERVMASSGKAVVVGGVTSAATFYAFCVTEFTGLRQMGLLTGTGILLCMISVLVLLPALLAWSEEHHRQRDTRPNHYLHSFGVDRLMAVCFSRPVGALAVGGLLTVGAGWAVGHLRWQDNIQAMRSPDNRGIQVLSEVSEHFGAGFEYMSLVVSGASPEEVLAVADATTRGVERLLADGVIDGFDSISRLIPHPEGQREAIAWLAEARRTGLADPELVRARFARVLASEGMRLQPFERGLDQLAAALLVERPLSVEDFQGSPQTARLLERYLRKTASGWKSAIKLYTPPLRWKREPPPAAVALAEEMGPQVVLTGVNVVSQALRVRVRRDAVVAALLGFVLVALLLWLDFRRVEDTVLSLAPLLVGILWMLGAMSLLGIEVNLMNIFVTTMILGIGVDYGVHVLHRYREAQAAATGDVREALQETGKAIVLAALSTIVGFGSMSLSRYPGLRSMGFVAILGAVCTVLVAITLLPAALELRERRHRSSR